jgi:hypothetical protein
MNRHSYSSQVSHVYIYYNGQKSLIYTLMYQNLDGGHIIQNIHAPVSYRAQPPSNQARAFLRPYSRNCFGSNLKSGPVESFQIGLPKHRRRHKTSSTLAC